MKLHLLMVRSVIITFNFVVDINFYHSSRLTTNIFVLTHLANTSSSVYDNQALIPQFSKQVELAIAVFMQHFCDIETNFVKNI
jgi:hypothetical protein